MLVKVFLLQSHSRENQVGAETVAMFLPLLFMQLVYSADHAFPCVLLIPVSTRKPSRAVRTFRTAVIACGETFLTFFCATIQAISHIVTL